MVTYIGRASVRVIRAADWEQMGITQDEVVWYAGNSYMVPLDELSAEAVAYLKDHTDEWLIGGQVSAHVPVVEAEDEEYELGFDELDEE